MSTTDQTHKNARGHTQSGRLTYESTERTIEVDGLNIHYHEAGEEHEHTIVFLHGGGPGSSGWFNFYLNIEPFSERFRTILIDMPNFGRSDAVVLTDRPRVQFYADILSQFLRLKGIERASLMGNSLGGYISIAFSVEHTDQLELNILMGAAAAPSVFDPAPPPGTALIHELFRAPSREGVERLMHLFVHDDSVIDDAFVDMRWAAVEDAQRRGFLDAIVRSSGPVKSYSASDLAAIAVPALVICGANDRFAALDSSVALMRYYPDSELHVFRNCGHWVQFELYEEFNELVISWMTRQLR